MVQHYALNPKASIRPYLLKTLSKRTVWTSVHMDLYKWTEVQSTLLESVFNRYGGMEAVGLRA